MDPTSTELAGFATVAGVAGWAGLADLADVNSVGGSLFAALGLAPTQPPRILGIIPEADYIAATQAWRIPRRNADGSPMDPPDRAPTVAEVGVATLFGRACRISAGNGETLEQLRARANAAKAAPPAPAIPSGTRKLKMSAVASQIDESEFELAPETVLMQCYKRYESVYGKGERPSQDQEPTPEQVSAVMAILNRGSPPYVDFGVWGPHGHRIMRKVRLSGLCIGRDGHLQTIELHGPPNIAVWESSFNVLSNTLVMLDAVDLGALVSYKQHIIKLHDRYSPKTWPILYQADNRCRLEHMERTRRVLHAAHEEAVTAGGTTDYDDSRPWNSVFRRVVADEAYWRDQMAQPALLVLTKIAGMNEVVGPDTSINAASSSAPSRETEPRPARMAQQPAGIRPRNSNRTGRRHQTEGGKYTTNRTGYGLCGAFNEGTCAEAHQGIWCPKSNNLVRQCDRCLGAHPSSRCPHGELQVPGFVKNKGKSRGGGGKNRGKGSKGRQPY